MSKRNVSAIKQDTPAFLKRFKEQIGYKDGPKLSDKVIIINYDILLRIKCKLCI